MEIIDMDKKYRYVTRAILASAVAVPVFAASNVQAESYSWNTSRYAYSYYTPSYSNYGYNNYNYNYGYNNYDYYYGYNNYNYGNYGYNYGNYGYNYGYNNWNNYYGYNNLTRDENYIYWNGNHYYRMNDGTYRIYRNGQWQPLTNRNNSRNNLANDPHYLYENGYHYYLLENGDYYYYQNGKWVFVKNSTETETSVTPDTPTPTPNPTPTPEEPNPTDKPDQPVEPSEPATPEDTGNLVFPENPPFVGADGEFEPFTPTPENPAEPKPEVPVQPEVPGNDGLVTTDQPSENQIPPYVEAPAEGLEHLPWAPNGRVPKLVYPPGKPGSAALRNDKNYYFDGTTHYYYVPSDTEATGYSAYWKWIDGKWKLQGMTDPTDPAIDPKFHEDAKDDEYAYSDRDSSVKLYSTNVVETVKAGQPLPFKNVEEFKDYVIKKMNPKFIDNAGWDAKVEWEIEDPELFEQSKDNPWAKDYVLIANLKSGVDEKEYKDVEFGYVKFVFRVEATDDTNYISLDKAKEAFTKINELRKAQGLKELTWSDDIYNNLALPKANQISRQYDSTGFVARREEDSATVATKWFNSGLRELLLDPNATEGAVAAVVNGDGYYYWAYNYK
jgi:hypothetical protein